MEKEDLIPANDFCANYNIEISFIRNLHQSGLLDMSVVQGTGYIPAAQIRELEKLVWLHYEMDINLEGIETIQHLLARMQGMQEEMTRLKNRLRLYESDPD
jgi:hypothetical protein